MILVGLVIIIVARIGRYAASRSERSWADHYVALHQDGGKYIVYTSALGIRFEGTNLNEARTFRSNLIYELNQYDKLKQSGPPGKRIE